MKEPVAIGSVYIPPINSRYSSNAIYDEIETDIHNINNDYKYICLTGDFNSRVSSEKDYTDYSHVYGSRVGEHELVLTSQNSETL